MASFYNGLWGSERESYGYHRLAWWVRQETGWVFFDNLAHKCCKEAGIHSAARRPVYRRPGGEHTVYGNLVNGHWNASRPLELVVSDMTCISHKGHRYEWTLFVDTYNNEILAHCLSGKPGSNAPYYSCFDVLNRCVGEKTNQNPPTTDQGAVYSSQAFSLAHEPFNIARSMSRVATPTDHPVMESLNGWMKDELVLDFGLKDTTDLRHTLQRYVHYLNHFRPAFALGYKSPIQFKTEQGF